MTLCGHRKGHRGPSDMPSICSAKGARKGIGALSGEQSTVVPVVCSWIRFRNLELLQALCILVDILFPSPWGEVPTGIRCPALRKGSGFFGDSKAGNLPGLTILFLRLMYIALVGVGFRWKLKRGVGCGGKYLGRGHRVSRERLSIFI